jgi:hypothetical protein
MPRSSRIKVGKKDLNLGKFLGEPDISGTYTGQVQSLVLFSRTNPVLFSDISGEAEHVRRTFSALMFYDSFEHNLLAISPIDLILLSLAL